MFLFTQDNIILLKWIRFFFEQLKLPKPNYHFDSKNLTYHEQISKMIKEISSCIKKEKINILLVQGDTNSVLAGAIASKKEKILLGHVEAGLRSYDLRMPEEHNRFICDHLSDFLFCPTEESAQILKKEGIEKNNIFVTGNTIVDAVNENVKLTKVHSEKKPFFILTLHRAENVDSENILAEILTGIEKISEISDNKIIFPVHPRTLKKINENNLKIPKNVSIVQPMGYLEFLSLLKDSAMVMTDSGGIQEEACVLKVPCITLRISTERPETVEVGANIIAGTNSNEIFNSAKKMINIERNWKNPFGDGNSAKKIIEIIKKSFSDFE